MARLKWFFRVSDFVRPTKTLPWVAIFVCLGTPLFAQAESDWTWRNPKPAGNPVNDVIWADKEFVAVTDAGGILRSKDGITWNYRTSGTKNQLRGIVWAGTQFVAVGYRTILTSLDGNFWMLRANELAFYNKVAWTGNLLVVVGGGGVVRTSPDGVLWTTREVGTHKDLNDVAWNGRQLVSVGDSGSILTSHDGVLWTRRASGTISVLNAVAWTGRMWVAVGDCGTVVTSTDGLEWSRQPAPTRNNLYEVSWTGSRMIMAGRGGLWLASLDGASWAPANGPVDTLGEVRTLAASDVGVVALGQDANGSARILHSQDGSKWMSCLNDPTGTLTSVTWGNQFVAVGKNGLIQTSLDGEAWVTRASGSDQDLNAVIWTGSRYLVSGENGTVLESGDGAVWRAHHYGAGKQLLGATASGGQVIFVGAEQAGNVILVASLMNLDSSKSITLGKGGGLRAVVWTGLLWVTVGMQGAIYTSPDGEKWTRRSSGVSADFFGLTWTGGLLVAAGADGTILTSPDGFVWTQRQGAPFGSIRAVAWTGKKLIALCDPVTVISGGSASTLPSSILTSADGITWVYHYTATVTTQTLFGLAQTQKEYVAVGSGGAILTSSSGTGYSAESRR